MEASISFALYIKFFIGLLAIVNPVGILPVFIALTANMSAETTAQVNRTASISVAIILWCALVFGDTILSAFGISVDSFRIAGGILLCSIAMTMVSGKLGEHAINRQEHNEASAATSSNIGVVPLALPMMAGPGAISSTIVWGSRYSHWQSLLLLATAVGIFALCCWALFRGAPLVVRLLGQTGINVITRIMGILLMALGIELVVISLRNLFPVLTAG